MKLEDCLNIKFIDHNPEVIESLVKTSGKILSNCEFNINDIFSFEGTLFSPANSIGDLHGGIDKEYNELFPNVEFTLKRYIHDFHDGQLKIGTAQIVPTHDKKFPYIIFSPTVTLPGDSATYDTVRKSIYAGLKEALLYNQNVKKRDRIRTILIPGLGTGCGGLNPEISALAIRDGYEDVQKGLYLKHL